MHNIVTKKHFSSNQQKLSRRSSNEQFHFKFLQKQWNLHQSTINSTIKIDKLCVSLYFSSFVTNLYESNLTEFFAYPRQTWPILTEIIRNATVYTVRNRIKKSNHTSWEKKKANYYWGEKINVLRLEIKYCNMI